MRSSSTTRSMRAVAFAWSALTFAGVVAAPASPAGEPGLREVGFLPYQSSGSVLRLVVDPVLNRGITIFEPRESVNVFDLATLKLIRSVDLGGRVGDAATAVVDPVRHRVFVPGQTTDIGAAGCRFGPGERTGIAVFDMQRMTATRLKVPCVGGAAGLDQFAIRGLSYDAASDRLYAIGLAQAESAARSLALPLTDRTAPTMFLRQMDPASGAVDWEIDLRQAGCDKISNTPDTGGDYGAFVQRHGDDVLAYCYGPSQNAGFGGRQGFVLKIPLERDALVPAVEDTPAGDGNVLMRVIPTMPEDLVPMLDPVSGRMMLLTSGKVNGDAVWIFDPRTERFLGTIASGVVIPPEDLDSPNNYVGFDERAGRVYFMNPGGMLLADVRKTPLPAGTSHPLAVRNKVSPFSGQFIAVAPALRRIFVPVADRQGFLVLEDTVPQAAPPLPPDLDSITDDIPEAEGKTGREFSAQSSAYGVHLLNTGGLSRIVNNRDPLCWVGAPGVRDVRRQLGGCLADFAVTSGTRELFLARTLSQMGSSTGSVANAAGAAFSTADTATDSDFRRAGTCYGDRVERTPLWQQMSDTQRAEFRARCASLHDGLRDSAGTDFREGTTGSRDHPGRPVRASECVDDGEAPTRDSQPAGADGVPWSVVSASSTSCDGRAYRAVAEASASAFGIPSPSKPVLGIGRSWTTVSTSLTDAGAVTTATATVTGVEIAGLFSIGEIQTTATTRARGRSTTSGFESATRISEVHGPGIDCVVCDPAAVAKAINESLGRYVVVRPFNPFELRSDRGAAAIVSKDAGERASDRTMNDDDTFEAAGLTLVFYNDGFFGRSRFVVSLAGVQAESHYGVFRLEEGGGGQDTGGGGDDKVGGVQIIRVEQPVPVPVPGPIRRITKVLVYPAQALAEGLRLLVNNPREAGLLFLLWLVLVAPVYFAAKRRVFSRAMTG